jgi:hypothetical protein
MGPDYATYRLAAGANLNRMLQRINSTRDFLLITPFGAFNESGDTRVPRSRAKMSGCFGRIRLNCEPSGDQSHWSLPADWSLDELHG